MGYCRETSQPVQEPVTLTEMKSFMSLPLSVTTFDSLIADLIVAAREEGERITGRALAQRSFVQVLDSHPYYTDTIQSQQAYPPSYYSLPRYSTTLWNYSQQIKLGRTPAISVEALKSISPDGTVKTMLQDTDFILDRLSEPARIFPLPGTYWPPDLYVANALQIEFTAGYDPDPMKVDTHQIASPPQAAPGQQPTSTIVSAVPQWVRLGIMNEVLYRFNTRGLSGAEKLGGAAIHTPDLLEAAWLRHAIVEFAPTRG